MTPALTRRQLEEELAAECGSAPAARWIVDDVLAGSPVRPGAAVTEAVAASARSIVRRMRAGEPLQYLLGHWSFRQLELSLDRRVLIPRPETEQVVEVALAELARVAAGRPDPVVVDLGTGSGAVALALATESGAVHPKLRVIGVDVDREALAVADLNRRQLGATEPTAAERVELRCGEWWQALDGELRGRVDLVVSNPPYVAEREWPELGPELRFEPYHALVAGDGSDGTPGLAAVEAVLRGAAEWLARPGVAVVELSPPQAGPARSLALALGADDVVVEKDLAGRERMVVARFSA